MIKNPAVYCITAISVSDIEKSTRFYNAAFGYRALKTTTPDNGAAGVTARFIELGGAVLELVEFRDPPPPEQTEVPMSRVGLLSHLAFNVDNLADTEAAIEAAGGSVAEATRMHMELAGLGQCEIVYARDPDGIWLELLSVDDARRRRYVGFTEAT